MNKVIFKNRDRSFFNSINSGVEEYFAHNRIKKTGNRHLFIKSAILVIAAISLYVILLTSALPVLPAIVCCCLLGLAQAGIGFNVMHDSNHGSFSEKKWVNNLLGLTANFMGANAFMWRQKHNIIHHTYTNIDGMDDDIAKSPFLRMCTSQKHFKLHRLQYLYSLPLYSFMSIWIFITDFSKYFEKRIQSSKLQKMNIREHFVFWLTKALYIFLFIAFPIILKGVGPALMGFAIMHAILGLTLAIVFQLAHVVEITHFTEVNDEHSVLEVEDAWAIHQVVTTADFAPGNKIISWFTGGLNFQVEHHLFPRISHVHYPAIRKIVQDTCKRFSVQYNCYPSLSSALLSHLRLLKRLGYATCGQKLQK